VGSKPVGDDNVVRLRRRRQELLHLGHKRPPVDRTVEHQLRDDAVMI
jgi:hypothetical protein